MSWFLSVARGITGSQAEDTTVTVNVSGQPVRSFKAPVIVSSVSNGIVNSSFIVSGAAEILLAIASMINICRSVASEKEMVLLGDLLCTALGEVTSNMQKTVGGD